MSTHQTQSDDLADLYRRAFAEHGVRALWNLRPVEKPTPSDALAITKALRTHGRMEGRRLAERIEEICLARERTGKREAIVAIPLEWVTDSAYRFFPTQPDELFGYVLHPVDMATNKASVAADRRVPRDIVDLLTIHEAILPLGAVVCAAVGRFPGATPEEMLAEITRHSRFTAAEFHALATEAPVDVRGLHRRVRAMIEDAERFIAKLPSDAVGVIFMDGDKPVQPDVNALDSYGRNPGAPGGLWPSSPEISSAMLERYGKPKS